MTGWVVAISKQEADDIARDRPELVHLEVGEADEHLTEVIAPPTDPYYAAQYRVYAVKVEKQEAQSR